MKDRGMILILYLKSSPDISSPTQLTVVHCVSLPVAMADCCYCPGPYWPHKIVQQSTSPLRPLVDSRVLAVEGYCQLLQDTGYRDQGLGIRD